MYMEYSLHDVTCYIVILFSKFSLFYIYSELVHIDKISVIKSTPKYRGYDLQLFQALKKLANWQSWKNKQTLSRTGNVIPVFDWMLLKVKASDHQGINEI